MGKYLCGQLQARGNYYSYLMIVASVYSPENHMTVIDRKSTNASELKKRRRIVNQHIKIKLKAGCISNCFNLKQWTSEQIEDFVLRWTYEQIVE